MLRYRKYVVNMSDVVTRLKRKVFRGRLNVHDYSFRDCNTKKELILEGRLHFYDFLSEEAFKSFTEEEINCFKSIDFESVFCQQCHEIYFNHVWLTIYNSRRDGVVPCVANEFDLQEELIKEISMFKIDNNRKNFIVNVFSEIIYVFSRGIALLKNDIDMQIFLGNISQEEIYIYKNNRKRLFVFSCCFY